MRQAILIVIVAVMGHLVDGCSTREQNRDVATRLRNTREDYARNYPDSELTAALEKATPTSLCTPSLIRCRVFGHSRRLLVQWIAGEPSANALRLIPKAGLPWDIHMDRMMMEENQRIAQKHVLYWYGCSFENEPDVWSRVWGMAQRGEAVVLIKDSQVVSNEVRLTIASAATAPSDTQESD